MASHADVNYRMVASIGATFISLTDPFLKRLSTDLEEATRVAASDPSRLICTAVLVGLGLELQLKSLRTGLRLPVPDTHDLWVLYKSLPEEVKGVIEVEFAEIAKRRVPTTTHTLQIKMTKKGHKGQLPPDQDLPKNFTARALLKRNANAFVSWRYFYESVPPGKAQSIGTFEFGLLTDLSMAFSAYIAKKGPP